MESALLTVQATATRLGVSTATVYGMCRRGELPHVRVSHAIRVAQADLEEVVRRGAGKARAGN